MEFTQSQVKSSTLFIDKIGLFYQSNCCGCTLQGLEGKIIEYFKKVKETLFQLKGQREYSIDEIIKVTLSLDKSVSFENIGFDLAKKRVISATSRVSSATVDSSAMAGGTLGRRRVTILENQLIFLDIIRKYVVITLLSKLTLTNDRLFNTEGRMNERYGVILQPGSGNITSDWDISFFLTEDGVDFFLNSTVSSESVGWLQEGSYNFLEIFDRVYPHYSVLFDNNFYFEFSSYHSESGKYQIPLFIDRIGSEEFIRLELDYLQKKINVPHGVNLGLQCDHLKNMFDKFKSSEYNEAFKQYLESRLYKSEAYATFSAVVAVVLEMQLEIKSIPSLLVKYPIIYFISATENAYDLYHHIETASKGVSGEISQEIIIKFSKYLKRISEQIDKYRTNTVGTDHIFKCIDPGTIEKINDLVLLRKGKVEELSKTKNCYDETSIRGCFDLLVQEISTELVCIEQEKASPTVSPTVSPVVSPGVSSSPDILKNIEFYKKFYEVLISMITSKVISGGNKKKGRKTNNRRTRNNRRKTNNRRTRNNKRSNRKRTRNNKRSNRRRTRNNKRSNRRRTRNNKKRTNRRR